MVQFIAPVARNLGGDGPRCHSPGEPTDQRGPLRIIAIGEPPYIREAITRMHRGTYQVDMTFWSPLLAIPENGLVIPRYSGQVFALLQKPEHLSPRGGMRA